MKIGPLVRGDLPLADTQGDFHPSLLPVHLQGDKCAPSLLGLSGQTVDLGSMQQKPAPAPGLMLFVACAQVRLNVAVIEKDLSPFDACE